MRRIRLAPTSVKEQTKHCEDQDVKTSENSSNGVNYREDCFHLSHSLPFLTPDSDDYETNLQMIRTSLAESIFRPFAEKRQPRTALLIKGARVQGDKRVASGVDAMRERDAGIVAPYKDPSVIAAKFDSLLREPFQAL